MQELYWEKIIDKLRICHRKIIDTQVIYTIKMNQKKKEVSLNESLSNGTWNTHIKNVKCYVFRCTGFDFEYRWHQARRKSLLKIRFVMNERKKKNISSIGPILLVKRLLRSHTKMLHCVFFSYHIKCLCGSNSERESNRWISGIVVERTEKM